MIEIQAQIVEPTKVYWLIEIQDDGKPNWFVGQQTGSLPSGHRPFFPWSPDANDAVAAGRYWQTREDAERARLSAIQCDQYDYYLLDYAVVTEHVFIGRSDPAAGPLTEQQAEPNVCVHCGEERATPHIAVDPDGAYCDECWERFLKRESAGYGHRYEVEQQGSPASEDGDAESARLTEERLQRKATTEELAQRKRDERLARERGGSQVTYPTLAEIDRRVIESRLRHFNGNRTHTAKSLDISIKTLQTKLRKWGLIDRLHSARIKRARESLYERSSIR